MTKDEVLEAIKQMSVIDLADLVKSLESEFGITAAAPVAMAAAPAAAAAAGSAGDAPSGDQDEEKTEFAVVLQDVGANKINVIKAVRRSDHPRTAGSQGTGGSGPEQGEGSDSPG